MRALLVVRQATPDREIETGRRVPGCVGETGIFLVFRVQQDVGDWNDVRREGIGSELRRKEVLRIDSRFLVRVECADQPLESLVARRREAKFLRELVRTCCLEKLKAKRTRHRRAGGGDRPN